MKSKSRYQTKDKVVAQLIGEMGVTAKNDDKSMCVMIEVDGKRYTMLRILFESLFDPAP